MIDHKDHKKCVESYKKSNDFVGDFPESEKVNGHCRWSNYHADLGDLNTHGKFRNVEITKAFEDKTIATRLSKKENRINLTKDAAQLVEIELLSLADKLYTDLSRDVFEDETVKKVNDLRYVCDLKSLSQKLKAQGSVLVWTLTADSFLESSRKITHTIHVVPDDIFKQSYKEFLKVLECHIKSKDTLDSKSLIKDFLDTDRKLFKGVEIIVQVLCAAAVKISVESDVESLVSRYEKHFKIDRQLGEENADFEMEIAENGPLLIHADRILKNAMDIY